jgi:hypothetical protein
MTYIFKVHVDQPHFVKVLYVFWWVEMLNVMSRCRDYNNINTRLEGTSQTAQLVVITLLSDVGTEPKCHDFVSPSLR